IPLRRLGQASRNKPRRALVFLLRPVHRRAGAKEISRDMEQNSEDAMGTKRSAEIHSGEVKRVRVSSVRAPRQASCFAEYRFLKITELTYMVFTHLNSLNHTETLAILP